MAGVFRNRGGTALLSWASYRGRNCWCAGGRSGDGRPGETVVSTKDIRYVDDPGVSDGLGGLTTDAADDVLCIPDAGGIGVPVDRAGSLASQATAEPDQLLVAETNAN